MLELECEVDLKSMRKPKVTNSSKGSILPPIVRTLVLAYQIEKALAEGRAKNFGEIARQLAVSQPRVTQIMMIRNLAPAIQERILLADPSDFTGLSEHRVRIILKAPDAKKQMQLFDAILAKPYSQQR